MKIPQILPPTELSDRVLAERYVRHPGPYAIAKGWQQDLEKIFPGIMNTPYDQTQFEDVYGQLGPSETELLHRVVSWLNPKVLVEYGTAYGRSTRAMTELSPKDARILTVDLPDKERADIQTPYSTDTAFVRMRELQIGEKYKDSPEAYKVNQVRTNILSDETLDLIASASLPVLNAEFKKMLKEGKVIRKSFVETLDAFLNAQTIDFAFIDAAHDYFTTAALFELNLLRLSAVGVILTDDYNKPSTHIGVSEYFATKAREEGFVFYHFNPTPQPMEFRDPRQGGIIFLNLPEAKNREWRARVK